MLSNFAQVVNADSSGEIMIEVSGSDVSIAAVAIREIPQDIFVDGGGNLVLSDADGRDDDWTIAVDGTNYRITNPSGPLMVGSGVTPDGPNDFLVSIASVTGEVRVDGEGGDDSLTVDFTSGSPVTAGGLRFDGGMQGAGVGDSLSIIGSFTNQTLNYEPPGADGNNGNLDLDGSLITYTGLEPINAGNSVNTILNLPVGFANDATLQNSAVAGEIEIIDNGATFEDTVIPNPTGSLTVNLGDAGDQLQVNSLDDAFAASLILSLIHI